MNRTAITSAPEPLAHQSLDHRITDHIPSEERITVSSASIPSRLRYFRRASLADMILALQQRLIRRPVGFTTTGVIMGLAFAFFAGKITLIMALGEWHPFLIGVASFFACG